MDSELTILAHNLRKTALVLPGGRPSYVGTTEVGVPYSEVERADPRMPLAPGVWESYEAMRELMSPGQFPDNWQPVLSEARESRRQQGARGPINVVIGAFFALQDNPDLAAKYGIEQFSELPEGGPDLHDMSSVREKVDAVIECPELRGKMMETMANLVPDQSVFWIDREKVQDVIEIQQMQGGTMVDLGCGVGEGTDEWATKSGMKVVGMERQYHADWYDELWKSSYKTADFTRADTNRMPLVDDSVDLAVMEFVVPHVTTRGLARTLGEAQRTLKPEGVLAVCPQEYDWEEDGGDEYWRYFVKEGVEEGSRLRQTSYRELTE